MTINVLTIEREYGSGAPAIAEKLAARLGWKLWDQQLTEEIARYLECDKRHVETKEERPDPLTYRLMKAFMRGSLEGSQNAPRMHIADAEGIRRVTEKIVRKIAAQGQVVIVGRGSGYYLQECKDAFHVFIYAPFEEKVRRIESEGKSREEAIDLAENVDRDRFAFIKQHFGIEWPRRHFFQLMINSTLGEDAVVETIFDSMAAMQHRTTVDPVDSVKPKS